MAKKHTSSAGPQVEQPESLAIRYAVSVACPTPLAANPLEVTAADKDDAWQQFCQANGIRATDWPVTIEAV